MNALLGSFAHLARRWPGKVVAVLGALTLVFAMASADQSTDTELTSFAPEGDVADALDRVQTDFGAGGSVLQVVVDAGEGGNVLSPDGIAAATAVEEAVESADPEIRENVQEVTSFGSELAAGLTEAGIDPAEVSDEELAGIAGVAIDSGLGELMSTDADPETGTARAGLVVVAYPSDLSDEDVSETSLALAERIDGIEADGIEISPFDSWIMNDALEADSQDEMGQLFSISLLLILGILFFLYWPTDSTTGATGAGAVRRLSAKVRRAASDVSIGMVGLIASIMWMMGISVLLGPGKLGLVGPFSQMATAVPVLLVGLGIDYAIHLTSRYREETGHGRQPSQAASLAVKAVGGALALATATTVLGFMTNLVSPLPPMRDFGVFTAVGVISAFVVMTLFVPSMRNLLDGRRARRAANAGVAASLATSAPRAAPAAEPEATGLGRVIGNTAVIARRAPGAALSVAVVLSIAAAGAATQIGTTFNQDDFIPEDSEIGVLVDRMDDLFGGGLEETTFVAVDGDFTDPALANALLDLRAELADDPDVRSIGGQAQVESAPSLVAALAADPRQAAGPEQADDPALADLPAQIGALGYSPEEGFAADADMAGLYELARTAAPQQASQVLGPDLEAGVVAIGTVAGQEGALELADRVEGSLGELQAAGATTQITSENLVIEDVLDALTASQIQSIVIALVAALVLLVLYYAVTSRRPVLGVITMIPSIAVVAWVLGTMWLLGISFNVMTAMVASMGIGIGVPYGIHVTYRFMEEHKRRDSIDDAVRSTVTHTGGAMAGSAATTAAGFGVLILASLTPMQHFGIIVAITIVFSFLAAVLVQPSCLTLWARHRDRKQAAAQRVEEAARERELAERGAPVG